MKRYGKMLICLVGGLVLSANAQAVTADAAGNPYQGIVERNAFGLKPPPAPPTPGPLEPEPPGIIPQGIYSGLGKRLALFKTVMPRRKPGASPKETSMILGVEQREGEIEVLAIDEGTGTITFKNHGEIQKLNLEKDGPNVPTVPAPAALPRISVPSLPGVRLPAPAPSAS